MWTERHSKAFDPLGLNTDLTLDSVGKHKMRSGGETHRYNPKTIHLLQQAAWNGDYKTFKEYTGMVDEETSGNLRSLLDFNYAAHPHPHRGSGERGQHRPVTSRPAPCHTAPFLRKPMRPWPWP